MTQGTCIVGINASVNHGEPSAPGQVLYRATALGCGQEFPHWRGTILEAELDALTMDAHACPERRNELHTRAIPFDRLRTKRDALHTESTLRYMPGVG